MTQTTHSHAPSDRPRVRRGLGLLVGVTALLTPLAIAPATQAKHTLRATGYSSFCATLLGDGAGPGGPGTPVQSVDGIGSLGSAVVQSIANLICYSGARAQAQSQSKARIVRRITAIRAIR